MRITCSNSPYIRKQGFIVANSTSFLFLANTVLAVHVLFVCFVVFGLLLIYLGFFLRWAWVRNPVFRLLHVAAIGLVVMQSWAGMICPLTTWEMALRARAGVDTYTGAFIQH